MLTQAKFRAHTQQIFTAVPFGFMVVWPLEANPCYRSHSITGQ